MYCLQTPRHLGRTAGFALEPNFPNPFDRSSTISYRLDVPAPVLLDVYTITGQFVQRLVARRQEAGKHSVTWDGLDASGRPAASGVYFYHLRVGESTVSGKMVLAR